MAVLCFSDVLKKAGIDPERVKLIRHSRNKEDFMDCFRHGQVMEYTAQQDQGFSRGFTHWAIFIAESGTLARFYDLAEVGEAFPDDPAHMPESFRFPSYFTGKRAFYSLKSAGLLDEYRGKLVIDWGKGVICWGQSAKNEKPIVAIAPPQAKPFPGFDQVLLPFEQMKEIVEDPFLYADWHAALSSVFGIYVIADTQENQLYVGSATGKNGILGRWQDYAADGHGGDKFLKALVRSDPNRKEKFRFSILQEFSPRTPKDVVLKAESLYKEKLLSRSLDGMEGLNGN